ncbi:MAG: alpha/beta fold hydrolase [Nevskia sp.]|nr:alpha/beta fold hydrolase [Nevskia sp.]
MNAPVKQVPMTAGFPPNPVLVKGDGAPLVYLHGLLGQEWGGFLDALAARRRVYAPAHAGSDEPDELRDLDSIHDLLLYYDDLFEKLGLAQIDLVGHSFGGMVAAEIAATYPGRVRKLVLIDPLGLWRDDAPVQDYLLVPNERRAALLLGDPARADVRAHLALPADPAEQVAALLHRISALASVSHFIWPVPERGLARRLHRVKAPTLIIWGEQDQLVPSLYAQEFAAKIAGATVETIAGAGHTPQFDQPERVAASVLKFL